MTNIKLKIESDFSDYYDFLSVNEGYIAKYVRKYSNSLHKNQAIAELRKLGVSTIPIGSVRQLQSLHKQLVVYTDVTKHKGEGKVIMESYEAMLSYPTCLASPYFENSGITNKFLQIGCRRFRIVLENSSPLKTGRILSIDEIQPSYNYLVGLPIFSIDYIDTAYGMLAVDFNTVQDLQSLNMYTILQPHEVINEVFNALVKYNKI